MSDEVAEQRRLAAARAKVSSVKDLTKRLKALSQNKDDDEDSDAEPEIDPIFCSDDCKSVFDK